MNKVKFQRSINKMLVEHYKKQHSESIKRGLKKILENKN